MSIIKNRINAYKASVQHTDFGVEVRRLVESKLVPREWVLGDLLVVVVSTSEKQSPKSGEIKWNQTNYVTKQIRHEMYLST